MNCIPKRRIERPSCEPQLLKSVQLPLVARLKATCNCHSWLGWRLLVEVPTTRCLGWRLGQSSTTQIFAQDTCPNFTLWTYLSTCSLGNICKKKVQLLCEEIVCDYAMYEHDFRAIVFITFAPKKKGEKYFWLSVQFWHSKILYSKTCTLTTNYGLL